MSEELENKLDAELEEAKATGEDSVAADATTPAGGAAKKRKGDVNKSVDPKADNIEKTVKTPQGSNDEGLKEEAEEENIAEGTVFESIFEGMDLSEDFKTKTVAIFEAAVHEKTLAVRSELEEQFEKDLAEGIETATAELVEKVDSYLDYVAEQWMEQNEVAIEASIKIEVAESLLNSLKGLVESHNLEINQEEIDRVAEVEARLAEQEEKYNAKVEELLAIREEKETLEREVAFNQIAEGLTDTQADKLSVLAEGITFDDAQEYVEKLSAIKEAYFTESVVTTDETELLEEEVEDESETKVVIDESVARYAAALSRFGKK